MAVLTKEPCQEVFIEPQVITIARKVGGINIADMEAIFGRLARTDAITGGDSNTVILESENQERVRVFNFTELPITKVSQDGIRSVVLPVDPSDYILASPVMKVPETPLWWSALAKTQAKPHDLLNKIVIAKSRFFIGRSAHEIKAQLRLSRIDTSSFDKLMTAPPFSAYYGGKRIQAVYAMFMYVVDVADFKGYMHLHERSSDTFVTFRDPSTAPAHPWDVSNSLVDCRAMPGGGSIGAVPVLTYRLVYHEHMPRTRYLREGSTVVELIPERDPTTEEGFYKHHYLPSRGNGIPGFHNQEFIPMEKITEEKGFYLTKEGAELNLAEQAIIAQRKEEQSNREQTVKAWVAALNADAKAATSQYKDYYNECLSMLREQNRKQATEHEQAYEALARERDALRDQVKQLKTEVNDRKREHEETMLDRKEMLEALKLIPVVIGIVGTIIALGQKGKKK